MKMKKYVYVQFIPYQGNPYYQCPICGMKYELKEESIKCHYSHQDRDYNDGNNGNDFSSDVYSDTPNIYS
jgi:hypothetical protein